MLPDKNRPDDLKPPTEVKHPSKTSRIMNKLTVAALAILSVAVGVFLMWSFQSENVLKVNNEPFPTRTIREHPAADGVVVLTLDYCKLQEVTGTLQISFVGESSVFLLPEIEEGSEPGCRVFDYPVLMPQNIEPGEYKIVFHAKYDLNPLKKKVVDDFESVSFMIEPEEE